MGDIEAMFQQVGGSPKKSYTLRLLCWKNSKTGDEVEVHMLCVHLFEDAWSLNCASFVFRRVANEHRPDFPEAIQTEFLY